ncbi:hypothetical protein FB45DRAFT_758806, partial [Roridomyces roridus]
NTHRSSQQCGQKPKFIDPEGTCHQYCSRGCASTAPGPNPVACVLHGCRATGKSAFANFCSKEHGRQGVQLGQVQACDSCHELPRASGGFCMACDHKFPGTRLNELAVDGTDFKDLRTQFLSEWNCPGGSRPKVEKVYQVVVPWDLRVRHEFYRLLLHPTKEIRVFHSALCICDLGTKNAILCEWKSCGICRAVKSCFHEFAFGKKFNDGRFGRGIYSYRNPTLADMYAASATTTPYRVMVACDATVGSSFEQVPAEESLFLPIADAIVPAYNNIIMYTL